MSLQSEFDRQLDTLLRLGYPRLAGLDEGQFTELVAPLRERLSGQPVGDEPIPLVLVVRADLVAAETAMGLVSARGAAGYVAMRPTTPDEYAPLPELDLPSAPVYLVTDVDTGSDTRGVTPTDALRLIGASRRSPLTIDEGIAVVTHHPEILEARNAFSILGSRRSDRRVPAIWLSRGRPRLGWCWTGNPHSWLGSASCGGRVG